MSYYLVKIVFSAVLIVAISEIAKRSTLAGGILASIPVISVLALIWLYIDTKDAARVSALATSVFWLVLPSLALFLSLPLLLRGGVNFYLALAIAIAMTIVCYLLMIELLGHFDMRP